jgi:predicted RNA-binding protein YlxR (DUF448 family)
VWQIQNKEYLVKYSKEYRISKTREISEYKRSFYLKNKQDLIKKDIKRNLLKRKDPIEKMKHNIRANISKGYRKLGLHKSAPTEAILGCTFAELRQHLTSSFKARYGRDPRESDETHIDHIKPIALAKTEQDLIRLNHFSNLQLLLAKDNLVKSNKDEEKQ